MRQETHQTRDELDVLDWRCEQLTRSGFEAELARRLAGDEAFDLHELIELVERGCPPELAVRIVAPLDARLGGR